MGDLGIMISCSGETPAVLKWVEDLKSIGAYVFSIIGNPVSRLAKISDYPIILDSCTNYIPGTPRFFCMYASFLLSPLPIKLITRLMGRGLVLPEALLRYYHSTME
jgi:fructoselysine-6-P-deglycase FrlB-like protein